tara:strand:+ start:5590 stop:5997 length:408 start_codon:yes stop_codon:yes gene_type:complete
MPVLLLTLRSAAPNVERQMVRQKFHFAHLFVDSSDFHVLAHAANTSGSGGQDQAVAIGQKQSFDTDHFERAAAGEDCRGRTIPAQSAFLWRLGLKYFSCGGTVTSGTLVLPSSIKSSSGIAARMGHENSTQLLST